MPNFLSTEAISLLKGLLCVNVRKDKKFLSELKL